MYPEHRQATFPQTKHLRTASSPARGNFVTDNIRHELHNFAIDMCITNYAACRRRESKRTAKASEELHGQPRWGSLPFQFVARLPGSAKADSDHIEA